MVKKTFKIDGMECPNCAMRLESIEDRLDGIRDIEANYHKGLLVVEYDEKKVSDAVISEEVARLGYRVTGVAAR